jgi:hypothetical protein
MTRDTTVAAAGERSISRVNGNLASVRSRRSGSAPALEAELDDGSGVMRLVWMGQRQITGIEPGRGLIAEGRVGIQRGRKTMYNPRYRLT